MKKSEIRHIIREILKEQIDFQQYPYLSGSPASLNATYPENTTLKVGGENFYLYIDGPNGNELPICLWAENTVLSGILGDQLYSLQVYQDVCTETYEDYLQNNLDLTQPQLNQTYACCNEINSIYGGVQLTPSSNNVIGSTPTDAEPMSPVTTCREFKKGHNSNGEFDVCCDHYIYNNVNYPGQTPDGGIWTTYPWLEEQMCDNCPGYGGGMDNLDVVCACCPHYETTADRSLPDEEEPAFGSRMANAPSPEEPEIQSRSAAQPAAMPFVPGINEPPEKQTPTSRIKTGIIKKKEKMKKAPNIPIGRKKQKQKEKEKNKDRFGFKK
tara:strand:- start:1705 stop:2682 length:978 start_codon:yes stop_codon:yes gene_type:complete